MGRFAPHDRDLPTVGDCKRDGMRGFFVHCMTYGCGRRGWLAFEALQLEDTTIFIYIALRDRRLVCRACGRRSTEISPDWRDHVAHGNGRRATDGGT